MLIIDMPMPRGCAECPLKTFGGACSIPVFGNGVNYKPFEERPDWCPIKGELVRCGECRHYGTEIGWNCKPYNVCKKTHMYCYADWFCADGERKDGERRTE